MRRVGRNTKGGKEKKVRGWPRKPERIKNVESEFKGIGTRERNVERREEGEVVGNFIKTPFRNVNVEKEAYFIIRIKGICKILELENCGYGRSYLLNVCFFVLTSFLCY